MQIYMQDTILIMADPHFMSFDPFYHQLKIF